MPAGLLMISFFFSIVTALMMVTASMTGDPKQRGFLRRGETKIVRKQSLASDTVRIEAGHTNEDGEKEHGTPSSHEQ